MNCRLIRIPDDNAIIKKGFFPDTAKGIDDTFIFVNLDFDLYKPTIDGLHFFWNKMRKGGVILIYDFFNDFYKGAKTAVDEFCKEKDISYIPIGDEFSVAIIK